MKKISLILLMLLVSNMAFGLDLSQCQKKTFIITGYYSPRPGQDRYYRGDYDKEVTLNGNGTHGASGKPVFNGMIAAPKTYKFGTKIYLEGIGLGEVSDRGGAIVSSGNRGYSSDRLDIWMGEGLFGLQNALSVGKRTVIGYVCDDIKLNIGFDYSSMTKLAAYKSSSKTTNLISSAKPKVSKPVLAVSTQSSKSDDISFTKSFEIGQKDSQVKSLQKILTEMKFYTGSITGVFDSATQKAVYDFQIANSLIKKGDSTGGFFGPKTRTKLEQKYQEYKKSLIQDTTKISTLKINTSNQKSTLASADVFKPFAGTYKKGQKNDEIKRLQKTLSMLGFYKGTPNGVYDQKTIDAIAQFQMKNFLVAQNDSQNKGILGEKTKSKLNLALAQISANMK